MMGAVARVGKPRVHPVFPAASEKLHQKPKETKWVSVQSSNLQAVAAAEGYLYVRFDSGAYRYPDAGHLFQPLLDAKSKGSFFHKVVRNLPFEKLCCKCNWNPAGKSGLCESCK